MDPEELLDAQGVARLLGLSPGTAYGLMKDGTLPATGWPRRVRWADVEAYLASCRLRPGQLRHLGR